MERQSSRFLTAFNAIEKHFCNLLGDTEDHIPFGTMIGKLAPRHAAVRHFQDKLRELAKLRNFIIHTHDHADPLATPSPHAIEAVEMLRDQLVSPAKLIDRFKKKVVTCRPDDPIRTAARKMHEGDFSQLPVYSDMELQGLLTAKTIARWLAAGLVGGHGHFVEESIRKVLKFQEEKTNFVVMDNEATVFDAVAAFEKGYHSGTTLDAIILTLNRKKTDSPTGIVTIYDMPQLQKAVQK